MQRNERRLLWLAVALSGLALLVAFKGFAFQFRRFGDMPRGAERAPAFVAPEERAPGAQRNDGPPWERAPYAADPWHQPPWARGHGPFGYRCGPDLGSLLAGGFLVALGVWLLRRKRPYDETRDPPPPDTPDASVV